MIFMISVIVPVYNVEEYLHVCLNSILKQTYQNFEIICIDDASTDSSPEILEYFSQKDSRIKILKNDVNRGPGYSRNQGLDIANGKYISFLDGDDWFSFNAFEILIEKAEQDNLDLLMFKNIVYYNDIRDFGMEKYYDMEFMNKYENTIFNHWNLDKTKLFAMSNAPWNKFYLKSFLDENNIRFTNKNLIHEDKPFFIDVITSAKRVSLIDKYLHNRRRRPNSITTLNNERLFDNIDIMYILLDIFFGNNDLYEYYKKELFSHIFSIMFKGKYDQIEEDLKDKFYVEVQNVCKVYIKRYGLYYDIKDNVKKDILDFFKFDEIALEISNSNPKVSVIVPVYNVEGYLKECLDSICNQTLIDTEIICVDDGSSDDSLNILKEYEKRDSRITIISQENKGLSGARNSGLKQAKGEYVYFLDSDDYIDLNALTELYEISNVNNLDMLLFKTCCFYDETNEKFTTNYFEMNFLDDLVEDNVFNYNDLGQKMFDLAVTMGSTFFKSDLISGLTFYEGLIFEDNPFFIEAMFKSNRMFFYNRYLYHKRERKESITTGGSKNFSDIIKIRNIIIDLAKEYNHFNEFGDYLYSKKLILIRNRFLQTSEEYKNSFFNEIQKDFKDKKEEYESDEAFQKLPENIKKIFYAGLNSNNYEEFESNV